jgi:hypothetical protein
MRPYGEITGKADPRLSTRERPAGRLALRKGGHRRAIDAAEDAAVKRRQKRAERRRARAEIARDR